jgi:hypothetical protein
MKKLKKITAVLLLSTISYSSDVYISDITKVPELKMKGTNLSFKEIEGYQNYQIVATHFRKDKNELRYVLANPIAYNALREKKKIMPDGSKIVKIGWTVNDISTFPTALEANEIQRVEYMIKDKTKASESDGWGYARFIKKNGNYESWQGDTKSCVACHSIVSKNDAVFSEFQKMF